MGLIRSLDAAPVEAARSYFKPLHQIDLQERLSEREESEVQNKAARLTDIELFMPPSKTKVQPCKIYSLFVFPRQTQIIIQLG